MNEFYMKKTAVPRAAKDAAGICGAELLKILELYN